MTNSLEHKYPDGTTRAEFARELHRAYDLGATATQLLELISEKAGRPIADLEFEILTLMKAAFSLSLGNAMFAIMSPRGRIRTIATDGEFDDRMNGIIRYSGSVKSSINSDG